MKLPMTIIGSMPPHDETDVEIEDVTGELPRNIVGSLPPPPTRDHRIIDTHFTPDGKITRCACGWTSHLCDSQENWELEWLEHL